MHTYLETMQRVLAAKTVGRDLGVRGRPHILTKEQGDQFMGFLKENYEGNGFQICETRAEVSKPIPICTFCVLLTSLKMI